VAQRVLDGLAIDIAPGEIRALAGQNGSGKSTLIKVLSGYHEPDAGASISVNGVRVEDDLSAAKTDLHFIHQDLALVSSLSAVDNLALGRGFATRAGSRIDWKLERRRALEAIARFDVDIDVRQPVGLLSPAQQAILAIVRAMQDWKSPHALLVLDEPTAALARHEAETLFAAVRSVAAAGAGVLFVSHKLNDVFDLCDTVSVLRDGKIVLDTPTRELSKPDLIKAIVGHSVQEHRATSTGASKQVLRAEDLAGRTVRSVSFELREGEILGVAGLVGSGREHIAGLICGSVPTEGGQVYIAGSPLAPGRPRAARKNGLALVPADRRRLAVFPDMEIIDHVLMPRLRDVWRRGRIRRTDEFHEALHWVTAVGLRPLEPRQKMTLLSGGNQQKAVLAQALRMRPGVLVLDEPGQGVDVGAKSAIYKLVLEAAEHGAGVIVCSSEAEELVQLCNRVLVFSEGEIGAELIGEQISIPNVVHATHNSDLKVLPVMEKLQ
jgi:ribose transport system ATP-binding protein